MKKDIFNGRIKEQYVGYMKTSIVFVEAIFFCFAALCLCSALYFDNMDYDMRLVLYILSGVVFAFCIAFPIVTILCIRSYPKHKAFTKRLVKEYVLKTYIDEDIKTNDGGSDEKQ